uniref:Uncharacterized protein n=1 Tax=Onchocerca volvulus TaxID=6282 RepID=A0A8R1TPV5_ONCVO
MSNRSKLLKVSASSQTEEKEYRSSQRLVWILVIVIRMIRLNAFLIYNVEKMNNKGNSIVLLSWTTNNWNEN